MSRDYVDGYERFRYPKGFVMCDCVIGCLLLRGEGVQGAQVEHKEDEAVLSAIVRK